MGVRDGAFDGCLCFCVVEMVTTALELVGQADRLGIRFQIDTDVLIIISFHCTTTCTLTPCTNISLIFQASIG